MKNVIGKILLSAILTLPAASALAEEGPAAKHEAIRLVPVRIEVIPVSAEQAQLLINERKRQEEARAKLEGDYAAALDGILAVAR